MDCSSLRLIACGRSSGGNLLQGELSSPVLLSIVIIQAYVIISCWLILSRISPALEAKLSKDKLYVISRMTEVQSFIKSTDYSFYQSLIEVLIPDVLRPIPSKLDDMLYSILTFKLLQLKGNLKSLISVL